MKELTDQETELLVSLAEEICGERYNHMGKRLKEWNVEDVWNHMDISLICSAYFCSETDHGRWHIKNSKLGAFV